MQTQNNKFSIESLPKRAQMSKAVEKFNKDKIVTNYYSLDVSKNYYFYQYDITFEPQLPVDSRAIIKGCVMSVDKQLEEKLKFKIHRGKIIYGLVKLEGIQSFKCNYSHKKGVEGQEKKYDCILNLNKTKEFNLTSLYSGSKDAQKVLQVLNSELKQRLAKAGLTELGNSGKFYKNNPITVQNSPFTVYRGFTTSIHLLDGKLQLLVDVSTRVIRGENLLKTFQNLRSADQKHELIGRSVFAKYGNWRLYKIKKIQTNVKITNTFLKNGVQTSYLQYFEQQYGVKIQDRNQQMILSSIKIKRTNKQGVLVQQEQDVYLAPELVSLTGMSDDEKNNFNLMKLVAQQTKIKPRTRIQQSRKMIQGLTNTKMFTIKETETKTNGYILEQPTIVYGKNQTIKPVNGIVKAKAQVLKPMQLKSWVLVYTQMNNQDRKICDDFLDALQKCSGSLGIKLPKPDFLVVESGKQQQYISKLEGFIQKYGKPPIVVTLLKQNQKKYYAGLKKFLLSKQGIPHQCVMTKTIDNDKRRISVCSKLITQMNAKIGNPLWKIQQKLPSLKGRKILIGGMAIYHKLINNNSSCCAFAGSVNDEQTEYHLGAKLIPQNQQKFDYLYSMVEQWVKIYCMGTKTVPDTLIVYRDGVGESQIQSVLQTQVQVIEKAIETIKIKMKKPEIKIGILFILANKKINQRLYDGRPDKTTGKQATNNPQSGTVVGQGISQYNFSFLMSSHFVTQGTCTPTQYNVIYNTSNLTQDQIWTLTFQSCFNYYNWQGAVRVPASLQYANKLSLLVGDSLKMQPDDKALKKKLYCL